MEFTFAPNLSKKTPKQEQDLASGQVKEIERLSTARFQKQVQQIMKETGCTFSLKKEREIIRRLLHHESQKQHLQPLLIVDVNLGNDQFAQVHYYAGDSAKEIACEFGKVHSLPPDMVDNLEHLLEL